MVEGEAIRVRITQVRQVGTAGTPGAVLVLDMRPDEGGELPPFSAGAHVDVHLGADLIRQYSLLNDPAERHRYVIAVALDADSRGGSQRLHGEASEGAVLTIGVPRCHFALVEDAPHSVLIAGGIGVTPLWAMAQRLLALGRPFAFHYGARAAATAPLLDEITAVLAAAGVPLTTAFEEDGGARLDLAGTLAEAPPGTHFYACGPAAMLDAYLAAAVAAGRPETAVHLERFAGTTAAATDGGFTVELARTGGSYPVLPGATILETLKAHGINIPHSCAEGICGACEAGVIEGIPDHRDEVLTAAERESNRTMMVCCSGARTPRLVLDL